MATGLGCPRAGARDRCVAADRLVSRVECTVCRDLLMMVGESGCGGKTSVWPLILFAGRGLRCGDHGGLKTEMRSDCLKIGRYLVELYVYVGI